MSVFKEAISVSILLLISEITLLVLESWNMKESMYLTMIFSPFTFEKPHKNTTISSLSLM